MAKKQRIGSESDALAGLCAVYERVLGLQFVGGSKPDRGPGGAARPAKAPDALLWTDSGMRLAIEHTRFPTVRDQVKLEHEFSVARDRLEIPSHVEGRFHVRVFLRGQSVPRDLRADLERWLAAVPATLPYEKELASALASTGLTVQAVRSRAAGLARLLLTPVVTPRPGESLQAEAGRLCRTLAEAAEKFKATPNARRAVVLHSDDHVNLSQEHVEAWLRAALTPGLMGALDDIWWLDTYVGSPVTHFFTAWWSGQGDEIGSVYSAEWIPETGHRREILPWAPGRPWWREGPAAGAS